MPQPQPEAEPPAAEPPRGVPAPRAGKPAVPVDQPTSTQPTVEHAAGPTQPAAEQPTAADRTRTEGLGPPEETGPGKTEPEITRPDPPAGPAPTRLAAPRWTGSAPVPPAARRDQPGRSLPGPRNPAEDFPTRSPETAEPVDPWADADTPADPWAVPGTPYPPVSPTLPYPTSGPAPTRLYPVSPATPVARPIPGPPVAQPPPPVSPPPGTAPPSAPTTPAGPSRWSTRRRQPPAPQSAPSNWRAPHGYAPPPARRKRRWPSRMMLLALLSIACCCGCPAYFGKPMWEQYPAKAALPEQVRDLTLRNDASSQRLSQRLVQETGQAHLLAEDIFAGVYRTSSKQVIVFGSTGFRLTPEQDVTDELTRLGTTYQITGVESVETSLRGQYQSCGTGRSDGTSVVVCTWADHGSLGTGVFTRLSVTDSAALLAEFRDGIVTRG